MEPSSETFNLGLFIWQLLALIAVILVFFLLLKIYKKISKYLDLKIKYLEKKIESNEE
jgi:F0F1-type ATP synthase membrane subunit b/b'